MTCLLCDRAAKFHSYQQCRLQTLHGEVKVSRAYYYCQRCHQSYCPYDDVVGLADGISPGLRPLVCLAGTLVPFVDAAEDVLRRYANVRLSASTVLRCTEAAGERLRAQQKEGRMVQPTQPEPGWTAAREGGQPAAYVGLDAFSVPMQGPGATAAEHRMMYTALLYTPDKKHTRYLVDFDLEPLAEQVRFQARAVGVKEVKDLVAVTDGGNGLEEALQRNLAENLPTVLDWYHAAEHVCDFAKVLHPQDAAACSAWSGQAKDILYEQGGEAFEASASHDCAATDKCRGARRVAKADWLFRKQSPPHRLPNVSPAWLGHRQRPHGGGLQDHRRALERLGNALG